MSKLYHSSMSATPAKSDNRNLNLFLLLILTNIIIIIYVSAVLYIEPILKQVNSVKFT